MATFEAISNQHYQDTENLQIYDFPIFNAISYQPLHTQHSNWDRPAQFDPPSHFHPADNFVQTCSEMGVPKDSLNQSVFSANIQSSLDPVTSTFNQFLLPCQMSSEAFANLDHRNRGIALEETFTQEGEYFTSFHLGAMPTQSQWPIDNHLRITSTLQDANGCGCQEPFPSSGKLKAARGSPGLASSMSQLWELESLGSILPSTSNCANVLPGEHQDTIYPDIFPEINLTSTETGISLEQDFSPYLIRSSAYSNFPQHPFPTNYISDTARLDGLREHFDGNEGNPFVGAAPSCFFSSNDKQIDTTTPSLNESTLKSSLSSPKKPVIRFNPLASN